MLLANYLIQKKLVQNGLLILPKVRAGSGGANEYSARVEIQDGMALTTFEEEQIILNNVIIPGTTSATVPTPPTNQAQQIKVLLVANDITISASLGTALTALGYTFTLDTVQLTSEYTGSEINVATYTTVIMYTNNETSATGAAALSTNLRSFVNAGGNLITATNIGNAYPSGFDFSLTTFIAPTGAPQNNEGDITLIGTHPITTGLTTLSFGFILTNRVTTTQSGATTIANYVFPIRPAIGINTVGSARLVTINALLTNITSNATLKTVLVNSILWVTRNIG
jgi:hypothetical protein